MKCWWIILCLFSSNLNAQEEITSFYLKSPVPFKEGFIQDIPEKWEGRYTLLSDSSSHIVFDSSGLMIESEHLGIATLEQIQKESAWYLKDGKIYGVDKDEALRYIERNDSFFFALNLDYSLVDFHSTKQKMTGEKDDWLIYEKVDNYWVIKYRIIWDKKGLYFAGFDHDAVLDEIKSWKSVSETKMNGYKTYIANPEPKELLQLIKNEAAFINSRFYVKLAP